MHVFESASQTMSYQSFGEGQTAFVWAHGWGQDHRAMADLSRSLSFMGKHYLIDLPGFGASPLPTHDWALDDYARFCRSFVDQLPETKVVWIGHSFGCRVGIKLAALKPAGLDRLILIAAAGLPRKRSLLKSVRFTLQIRLFKALKFLAPTEDIRNRLRAFFGSADYNNAGPLRRIFMNTINENLQDAAAHVDQPVLLIYGAQDNDTPPEIGQRLAKLMPNAQLRILSDFDHYSILTGGKHQVIQLIKNFVLQAG